MWLNNKFHGVLIFQVVNIVIAVLCSLYSLFFRANYENELEQKQPSKIYQFYFIARMLNNQVPHHYLRAFQLRQRYSCLLLMEFDKIRIQADVKLPFIQTIGQMSVTPRTFFATSVVFFFVDLLLLSHSIYWLKFLENSWCSLNFYAREHVDKGKYKF